MHGTLNGASPTLSTDVRHNVLLLVKEALHNAARHGGSKSITIRWRLTTGQLLVTIRDDGAGFDPSLASTGNGLKNLRRRAASMHASLRLETALGRGTCVEVDVPLRAPRANYPSM